NRLLEESGYLRWAELRAQRDGSPRALLNLRKVFQLAGRFERDLALAGIGDFVRHLDQVIDAELPVGEAAEEAAGAEAVSLLTIHAAKGLELPIVFLVNLRPPRPRDTERLFFDPDHMRFVIKNWRGEKHPHYVDTSPGAPAVALAIGERRRIVYVGLTRAKDSLRPTSCSLATCRRWVRRSSAPPSTRRSRRGTTPAAVCSICIAALRRAARCSRGILPTRSPELGPWRSKRGSTWPSAGLGSAGS